MSQKLFALVKWIGGQDDKKYTPDVPVSWIKDFNLEHFESDRFDPSLSYVIEWHGTKKMPTGGWPVHDGYVIAVSRSITTLENKLKALDGLLSPRNKGIENEHNENTDAGSSISNDKPSKPQEPVQSTSGIVNKGKQNKRDKRGEGSGTTDNSKADKSKHGSEISKCPDVGNKNVLATNSNNDTSDGELSDVSGCVRITKKKKTSHRQLYKGNPETAQDTSVVRALAALREEMKRMRKKRSNSSDSSTSDEDEQKEVGRRGSGVLISNAQWDTAKAANSYTAMGISLMLSLFPMKVLLASNLRGGASKLRGPNERRPALDQKIIEALFYTVQKSWKKTFNKCGLGIALNNKLTQLRASAKKNPVAEEAVD